MFLIRVTTIRNGLKQTISTSDDIELLLGAKETHRIVIKFYVNSHHHLNGVFFD